MSTKEIAGAVTAGGEKGAGAPSKEGQSGEVPAPAPSEPTPIGIYYITLGISTYRWLCKKHVAERKTNGWTCKRTGGFPWLECDDCLKERNERG